MITVVIPIGPNPVYRDYLVECIESVAKQTYRPREVLIVDDQAHLTGPEHQMIQHKLANKGILVSYYETLWLSGVAHAFNFGVALAKNNFIFMLGSDDLIRPWCLQDCIESFNKFADPLGYYYVDVQYSDTGETQTLACHAAMVTKRLWCLNGGFPVESAVGAPDTMLISIMLGAKGKAGKLYHVESEKPPYFYRRHEHTDTASRGGRYHSEMMTIRSKLTEHWQKPNWTRWKDMFRMLESGKHIWGE